MANKQWLPRTLMLGPFICLCLDEASYLKEVKRLKINNPNRWLNKNAGATTHCFEHDDGKLCVIICMDIKPTRTMLEHESLLVHEAVHVFQKYCEDIGEDKPSAEFEAYSIQRISLRLMTQFQIKLLDVDPKVIRQINKVSRERLGV